MSSTTCRQCGRQNSLARQRCKRCGALLEDVPPGGQATTSQRDAQRAGLSSLTDGPVWFTLATSGTGLFALGAVLFLGGLAMTVGGYWLAANQGGGRYILWIGAMLGGVILMLRGLGAGSRWR